MPVFDESGEEITSIAEALPPARGYRLGRFPADMTPFPPSQERDEFFIKLGEYGCGRIVDNQPQDHWVQCQSCKNFFCEKAWTMEYDHAVVLIRYSSSGKPYCPTCAKDLADTYGDNNEDDTPRQPIPVEVPSEFVTASETDYKGDVRKLLQSWPKTKKMIGIHGIPGSGKTRATWAIAKRMGMDGRKVWRESANDLKGRWLALASKDANAKLKFEQDICNCVWLIIDDLSGVSPSPGWTEFVHQILEKRTVNMKPTLITMAVEGDAIEKAYGPQIRSRMALFEWVLMPPKDWRQDRHLPKPKEEAAPVKPNTLFDAVKLPPAPPVLEDVKKQPNIGGSSQ